MASSRPNFGIKQSSPASNRPQGNFQVSLVDKLVTIEAYDHENHNLHVIDERGNKHIVFVKPETFARMEALVAANPAKYASAKYMQHKIDKNMEKHFPAGKGKVILSRSRFVSKDRTTGVYKTEAERIVGVTTPANDKTFSGLFTVTSRKRDGLESINRVQSWEEKAYDLTDADSLEELAKRIDEARSTYGEKIGEFQIVRPNIGIQFRAAIKTSESNDDGPIYEAFDLTRIFDWIVPEKTEDENGNKIAEPHLLTGDELYEFAQSYASYIQDKYESNIADIIIEVAVHKSYPASKNKNFVLTNGEAKHDSNAVKNPLYRHSHRVNFVDQERSHDDSGAIQGYNSAFKGVLQLSANSVKEIDGQAQIIPSYWASAIHPYGFQGHLHSFIRTSNGYKVKASTSLKLMTQEEFLDISSPDVISQPDHAPEPVYNASEHESDVAQPASNDPGHTKSLEVEDNLFGDNVDWGNSSGNGSSNEDMDNFFNDSKKSNPPEAIVSEAEPAVVVEEKPVAEVTKSTRKISFGQKPKDSKPE